MNSKERMNLVMKGEPTDRIPLMCQMALGHIYKHTSIDPVDYWYTTQGLGEGYILMAEQYKFDGILLSLPGRDPGIKDKIDSVENTESGHIITWDDEKKTFVPEDDFPYPLEENSRQDMVFIKDINIEDVVTYHSIDDLPYYYFDLLDYILERKGKELSIHGEVGTSFERFLDLFDNFSSGLMALIDDPGKCKEIINKINKSVIVEALAQCSKGIDALKLSSPFAGAGFISRDMYIEFVLPFEKELIDTVTSEYDIPCYIHTCGSIGDRLDLMVETNMQGIECLDPPPLGTVNLEEAINEVGEKVFIKGNLDSVNELKNHTTDEVIEIARKRLELGKKSKKGFILSTACSIAPDVPCENVEALYKAIEMYGGIDCFCSRES